MNNFSKFMNIWEIESQFKCPVVGTMLSVERHKQILKKCGYDVSRMKPYEFHQQLMSRLHEQNNVSIKVNNFIRTQAVKQMKLIQSLGRKQIQALWEAQLKKDLAGPLMYAIIAHEDTGPDLLQEIYGQVHMQAHANMQEVFTARQQLSRMEDSLAGEKKKLAAKIQEIRILVDAKKQDAHKIFQLEAETRSQLRSEKNHPSPDMCLPLEQKIEDLSLRLSLSESRLREMEREKKALQIKLFESKNENQFLKDGFQALSENFAPLPPEDCISGGNCCQDACPQYQLCAKRVFMIGGITKMKSYYKDIVENAGGQFDYHDGYMKNGHTNLEARVKRCDLVLCPVNCNSHNACLRVKKLCTRFQKPLKILGNSSLSAVSRALFIPQDPGAVSSL